MPEISVLIPVCNVENYLAQCLDSVVNQTFEGWEAVCVNDGSTDESGRILERYAGRDSRIRVIHKENTGYGNSMNVALEHAKGDYIAILESDDFAEPDMLEKLYRAATETDADIVKGNYYNYREGEDRFSDRLGDYRKNHLLNRHDCPNILNLADTIWSCLYKRSFLTMHEIRFHETPGASYQDISFALQGWIRAERVYFIEDPLLHYRRDNPGSSMNNPQKLFCVFEEYEWAEEKLEGIWNCDSTQQRYFTASKYRDYLNHYYRVGLQYQYALLLRLEQSFREDKKRGRVYEPAFFPEVWDALGELEADRNGFFRRTAKAVPDPRLDVCRLENEKVYAEAFFRELKSYPQVLIYGAGRVGQRLAKEILRRGGNIHAFLVSRLSDSGTGENCMGLSVMEVPEAAGLAEGCAVVLAVAEWSQHELYVNLETYGFRHIFRVDTVIRKKI